MANFVHMLGGESGILFAIKNLTGDKSPRHNNRGDKSPRPIQRGLVPLAEEERGEQNAGNTS